LALFVVLAMVGHVLDLDSHQAQAPEPRKVEQEDVIVFSSGPERERLSSAKRKSRILVSLRQADTF
jgi:hypothetical protein